MKYFVLSQKYHSLFVVGNIDDNGFAIKFMSDFLYFFISFKVIHTRLKF